MTSVLTGRRVPAVALFVAGVWVIGAALPIGGYYGGPATTIDQVSIWWYSAMLASLAVVSCFAASLSLGDRTTGVLAWMLAGLAILGAIGNALEDAFHVPNAEYLYGIGLLGTLPAMLGLGVVLAVRRRWFPATVVGGTLLGLLAMAGHGPPVMPVLWLAVAISALARTGPAAAQVPR